VRILLQLHLAQAQAHLLLVLLLALGLLLLLLALHPRSHEAALARWIEHARARSVTRSRRQRRRRSQRGGNLSPEQWHGEAGVRAVAAREQAV
jgi:hypothetical protein